MAAGDIIACAILGAAPHNGWVADITIEGWAGKAGTITYDYGLSAGTPDNRIADHVGPVFAVVSEGYDNTGALGTIARAVLGVSTIRKAYPNHAQLDERDSGLDLIVRVSLSDFIYDDDKNGGAGTSGTDPTVTIPAGWAHDGTSGTAAAAALACTNGSTLDYPKVIGRFAWPGFYKVTADFVLEACLYHRFARNHNPVACVKFDAADQSAHSSAQVTVTQETLSARTHASGLKLPVYAATMDVDALDQGEVIDCRFRAYPWVGDENSVLDTDTGTAPPSEDWGPLALLNDKSGTYGEAFAAVDGVGGGTPAVAATESAARSNPYATLNAAAAAIKAYNNTNYGRNSADGGTIVCEAGSYAAIGSGAGVLSNSAVWLTVRPATGVSGSAVTITDNGNTISQGWIRYQGVKVADAGATATMVGSNTAGVSALWLDSLVDWDCTGLIPIYSQSAIYITDSVFTNQPNFSFFGSNAVAYALFRGNDMSGLVGKGSNGECLFYCVLANKGTLLPRAVFASSVWGTQSENAICAYNQIRVDQEVFIEYSSVTATDDIVHGAAIVGNVCESYGAAGYAVALVASDNSQMDANNIILWHNTFAGQRINIGYNDNGTVAMPRDNFSEKFNAFRQWNNKGDIFATDGNLTGNWPVLNQVGAVGNHHETLLFVPDFDGLEYDTGTATYVDDQSGAAGTGGGDYTPDTGSPLLNRIPAAAYAPIRFDLFGSAIQDNGDAGAIQVTAPAGGGGTRYRGAQMTALLAGGTPDPGYVYGTPRCFVEQVELSGQAVADTIEIARLPKGAVPLYGTMVADVSLGASTIAIGISGAADKYRGPATLISANSPLVFGQAAGTGAALAQGETIIATVGAAALPGSGVLRVVLLYAFD